MAIPFMRKHTCTVRASGKYAQTQVLLRQVAGENLQVQESRRSIRQTGETIRAVRGKSWSGQLYARGSRPLMSAPKG